MSVAILALLATGRPVAQGDLAAALAGKPAGPGAEAEAKVSAAMERMPNVEFDVHGRIVGCGLTLSPTDHEIVFTGPRLYTWCAFDTVLFPVLLGRSAEIQSRCHVTDVPIRCSIGPDRPKAIAPTPAVISLIVPDRVAACCDLRDSFCQHVHFFASPAAATAWRAAHESGHLLSVADAHTIARRIRDLRSGLAGHVDDGFA